MASPEEVLLHTSAEMANWARHYDSARFQLTALILALSGAAVSFAISTHGSRVRVLLLNVTAITGVALSILSAEYSRLYFERSEASFQLRQLATQYQSGEKEPSGFNSYKVKKKIYKAYFKAFGEKGPSVANLNDHDAAEAMKTAYGGHGVLHWRQSIFLRLAFSFWLWLNFGVGVLLPVSCLVFRIRGEPETP